MLQYSPKSFRKLYSAVVVGLLLSLINAHSAAPNNDQFNSAREVKGAIIRLGGTTKEATTQADEPGAGTRSVWFEWKAPSTADFKIGITGPGQQFTTTLHTGTALASLAPVSSTTNATETTFSATQNTTYFIRVASDTAEGSNFGLRITTAASSEVIYSSHFETTEGYTAATGLVGASGWTGQGNGQGILASSNTGSSQKAFVGLGANGASADTQASRKLEFPPTSSIHSKIRFSVGFEITDSTNLAWDDFGWRFYNNQGTELFRLNFDNESLEISYQLAGATPVQTGKLFENGSPLQLDVVIDFATNKWTASLDSVILAQNQPLCAGGVHRSLDRIETTWTPKLPAAPGDNQMRFDDYEVKTEQNSLFALLQNIPTQTASVGEALDFEPSWGSGSGVTIQWKRGDEILSPSDTIFTPNFMGGGLTKAHQGVYTVTGFDAFGNAVFTTDFHLIVRRSVFAPVDQWMDQHFAASASAIVFDLASDPDGDGLTNDMEYAMGTNPQQLDAQVPFSLERDGNDAYVHYTRLLNSQGALYQVHCSGDLENWAVNAGVVEILTAPAPIGYERVRCKLSNTNASLSRIFTKISVELQH
jgi:hypothetical protein